MGEPIWLFSLGKHCWFGINFTELILCGQGPGERGPLTTSGRGATFLESFQLLIKSLKNSVSNSVIPLSGIHPWGRLQTQRLE